MKRVKYLVAGGILGAFALVASVTIAGMGPGHGRPGHGGHRPPCEDPIPDGIQARLLDRFGEEGIDADGNGVLTCEEVHAFFASMLCGKGGRCAKDGSEDPCGDRRAKQGDNQKQVTLVESSQRP